MTGDASQPKLSQTTSYVVGAYSAYVLSAHDGDSLRAQVMVWPSQLMEATIRLRGVDTPELNSKCEAERRLAQRARDFVRSHIVGQAVTLTDVSKGKYYGRVIASVTLHDGGSLGDMLLREGLGLAYNGGKRTDWCDLVGSL
ncbi:MAG: thermonuclease family protein [Pseudomonadota bacterium]